MIVVTAVDCSGAISMFLLQLLHLVHSSCVFVKCYDQYFTVMCRSFIIFSFAVVVLLDMFIYVQLIKHYRYSIR